VNSATFNGVSVTSKDQRESSDWHPHFMVSVKPGTSTLAIRHSGMFGYFIPFDPPRLAEPSANLKVISERWSDDGQTLALTVQGLAGRDYRIGLTDSGRVEYVSGATWHKTGDLTVTLAGDRSQYVTGRVAIRLRPL
jgi:hypothetical protein